MKETFQQHSLRSITPRPCHLRHPAKRDSVGGFYYPEASKITLRTICNRFCGRSILGLPLRRQFWPTDQNIMMPSSAQNQTPQFFPRKSKGRIQKLYGHRWFFRTDIRYHAPPPRLPRGVPGRHPPRTHDAASDPDRGADPRRSLRSEPSPWVGNRGWPVQHIPIRMQRYIPTRVSTLEDQRW